MGKLRTVAGVWLLLIPTMLVAWGTQTTAAMGIKGSAAALESRVQKSAGPTITQSVTPSVTSSTTPETAIRAELEEQVAAWNRGDLKGYMRGYWNSPKLTFFAGSQESTGWDAAYQRYRSAYLGKDKQMGRLNFTGLRVEMLGPESAFVRGGWQLTMNNGSKRTGLFTVVLKKFSEGWRIIHDHSS